MPLLQKSYHFFTRKGYSIRESRFEGRAITFEVELNGRFVIVIEKERNHKKAINALDYFLARKPSWNTGSIPL